MGVTTFRAGSSDERPSSEHRVRGPNRSGVVSGERSREGALRASVLVVEDATSSLSPLVGLIEQAGHDVLTACGMGAAVEQAFLGDPAVIVIDDPKGSEEAQAIATRLRSFEITRMTPLVIVTDDDVDARTFGRLGRGGPIAIVHRVSGVAAVAAAACAFVAPAPSARVSGIERSAPDISADLDATKHGNDERMAHALALTGVGVWALDPVTGAMSWDARCEELLGLPAVPRTCREFFIAMHEDDRSRVQAALAGALRTSQPAAVEIEVRAATFDGPRWLELRAIPVVRDGVAELVGVVADHTAQKIDHERCAALLQRANEACCAAELGTRARDARLQEVCHELRNPLSVVLGWVDRLMHEEDALDATQRKRGMRVIARQTRTQTRLIEDILDASSIVSGKLRVQRASFDVRVAVDGAARAFATRAEAAGVTLVTALEGRLGSFFGDEDRVVQVLSNLLSNAIKFTPRGGTVEIGATRSDDEVVLFVRDDGRGIARSMLPLVFDRFWQGEPSPAEGQAQGLGLGLALVRELVELHGGSVRAMSEGDGKGASFEVRLPTRDDDANDDDHASDDTAREPSTDGRSLDGADVPAPGQTEPSPGRLPLAGRRVLVLDDERDVRDLIARILQHAGATVERAATAREAMTCIEAARPDVVLSDITLQNEDGFAFVERLRKHSRPDLRNLPVAAMTAHTFDDAPGRTAASGFQEHLVKPIHPKHLVDVVARLAENGDATAQ